jgi:predicted SAM-dependent methyltransferase
MSTSDTKQAHWSEQWTVQAASTEEEPQNWRAPCRSLELVDLPAPYSRADLTGLGLAGIQFGSADGRHPSCLNSDIVGLTAGGEETAAGRIYRVDDRTYFIELDACRQLPFAAGSFDWIYAEHVIEHLKLADSLRWLRELRRLLATGGTLRLTTPNLRRYVEGYLNDDGFFRQHRQRLLSLGMPAPDRPAFMLNQIFQSHGHKWIFDLDELRFALGRAGFAADRIVECAFQEGARPDVAALDRDVRNDETIYVEATA